MFCRGCTQGAICRRRATSRTPYRVQAGEYEHEEQQGGRRCLGRKLSSLGSLTNSPLASCTTPAHPLAPARAGRRPDRRRHGGRKSRDAAICAAPCGPSTRRRAGAIHGHPTHKTTTTRAEAGHHPATPAQTTMREPPVEHGAWAPLRLATTPTRVARRVTDRRLAM